jgi:hypothetical protein
MRLVNLCLITGLVALLSVSNARIGPQPPGFGMLRSRGSDVQGKLFLRGGAKKSKKAAKSGQDSKETIKAGYDYLKKTKKESVKIEEAIMQRKRHKNSLDCLDSKPGTDPGVITISSFKADELGLEEGDVVRLKGKRHKETCAILAVDDNMDPSRIMTSKGVRANLRLLVDEMVDVYPLKLTDERGKSTSKPPMAKKVEVLPFKESLDIHKIGEDAIFDDHVKPYFTSQAAGVSGGRPVMMGDIFMTEGGAEFQVIDVQLEESEADKANKKKKSEEDDEEDEEDEEDEVVQAGDSSIGRTRHRDRVGWPSHRAK